jgi:3-methyladenine DNA glycosylase AlkC
LFTSYIPDMSTLLKDLYCPEFYDRFSHLVEEIIPGFDKKKFTQLIFDENWASKELKERMQHTCSVLHQFLPKDFEKAISLIQMIIIKLRQQKMTENSLEFMFFPGYIESYGLDHFDISVQSIEFVTQFTSCEFAVRPFIIKYGDRMMQQMQQWSLHENHHVRRLASEGCRPRLPWAMAIPALKKDPTPILPILANLKDDPSEYVRRSVANNLNDIAKDHPQIVIQTARQWKGISKETDALVKHGCRTLLKQGHPEILSFYGLSHNQEILLSDFKVLTPEVKIGAPLEFSFTLYHSGKQAQTVRLEYGIYYLKQKGQHSKKVFKISERMLNCNEKLVMQRKQSFKLITTRKFYTGPHRVSLIINGRELETIKFELTK